MSADLDKGSYTVRQVAGVAGVNRSLIAEWINKGMISAPPSPGQGHVRELTLRCAVEAVTIAYLNRIGIRSGTIASIIWGSKLFSNLTTKEFIASGKGLEDFIYHVHMDPDGEVNSAYREYEHHRDPRYVDDERPAIQIVIDFGKIIATTIKALAVA